MQAGFQDAIAFFDEIAIGAGFLAEPVLAVLFLLVNIMSAKRSSSRRIAAKASSS